MHAPLHSLYSCVPMLEAYGLTDRGCVRSNNEDYFIADARNGIFILADGMGGANAGEYASRLSAERLYEFISTADDGTGPELMERAFQEANLAVLEAARANPELEGMGTTLIAARAAGGSRLQIASVGDSRAYLCSSTGLERITRDQTWVAEIGAKLGLADSALKKHPMRHVLTMAIGKTDDLRVQSETVELGPGQQILLCSDGLHGVVGEDFLERTLLSEKTLAEKAHYLVEAAKNEGGPDNITVVLIQVH